MVVLVPWKPVVILWLLLSGMVLTGYVASRLMEGKPLFTPYSLHRSDHGSHHRAHRPA